MFADEDSGATFGVCWAPRFREARSSTSCFAHAARGLACKTQDVRGGAPNAGALRAAVPLVSERLFASI